MPQLLVIFIVTLNGKLNQILNITRNEDLSFSKVINNNNDYSHESRLSFICFGEQFFLFGIWRNIELAYGISKNSIIQKDNKPGVYKVFTLSDLSPLGNLATATSGLSSGGGGWGTQLYSRFSIGTPILS